MANWCVISVLTLLILLVQGNARNIPNSTNNLQEGETNVVDVSKVMPPNGKATNVKDNKCGVAFAGVGGAAGAGGAAGVVPLGGGVGGFKGIGGGIGGFKGIGGGIGSGIGGFKGIGGLGGIGGAGSGAAGGVGGGLTP